jgi:hypothetical protein
VKGLRRLTARQRANGPEKCGLTLPEWRALNRQQRRALIRAANTKEANRG